MEFDYGIIGGGPAGYTAAMNLASKGAKVILFEKDKLGGTCLNRGCIPTKSLLHSSKIYSQIQKANKYGLELDVKNFDFTKIVERKNTTIEKIQKGLELTVKNFGVEINYNEATIKNNTTIVANGEDYTVKEIILATGSKPKDLASLKRDGEFILNSDDILNINQLPKSILIVGSGAIGIEWARIFNNFGVEVILLEKACNLIPLADIDVSKRIERIFKQNKIKYYTNNSIQSIVDKKVTLETGEILEPELILSAVGREPQIPNTELTKIIGDASNEILLAHYAIHQGIRLASTENTSLDKSLIPSVIYGEPEIAWVGIREQDCDDTYQKVLLPITALGKSWCDDAIDGFIKIITKDNYIKGAHIVSEEASALIHQVLIAMQHDITIDELKKVCFAHPTYSEGIFEALCRI